jgi:hypothetical protein
MKGEWEECERRWTRALALGFRRPHWLRRQLNRHLRAEVQPRAPHPVAAGTVGGELADGETAAGPVEAIVALLVYVTRCFLEPDAGSFTALFPRLRGKLFTLTFTLISVINVRIDAKLYHMRLGKIRLILVSKWFMTATPVECMECQLAPCVRTAGACHVTESGSRRCIHGLIQSH